MHKKLISVVVCTHNGSKKISQCLSSLMSQSIDKDFYEVIVVDDGSTDQTSTIISKYAVTLISNTQNKGLAESRNIGIKNANSEIIAFTDDDCIVDRMWLKNIINEFEKDSNAVGISGIVETHEVNNIVQKYISYTNPISPLSINLMRSTNPFFRLYLYIKRQFNFNDSHRISKHEISSVVGANMAFRKDILNQVGGFDKAFTFGGEEEEISYRFQKTIASADKKLYFTPNAVVRHQFDESFMKSVRRNYMYGIGNARLKQKFPERSITILPFPILAIIFIFISFIVFGKFGVFSFLIIELLYSSWIVLSIKQADSSLLVFPFFQFIMELATNIGWSKQFILRRKS